MKPIDYWNSLEINKAKGLKDHQQYQAAYAKKAGSSFDYLNKHIFKKSGRSRNPSWKLLIGLALYSEGNVSLDEAIDYFLIQPVKKLAKDMQEQSSDTRRSSNALSVSTDNVQQLGMVG